MAKKPPGCKKRVVRIKKKRGGIVEFTARSGSDCKPRTAAQLKKSTKAQKEVRALLKKASAQCGKRHGWFTKASGKCVRDAFRT